MRRLRFVTGLVGLGLAIIAVARDDKRIAWAAIVVLAIALVVRLVARRRA
jgi:hypothetical protein